VADVGVKGAKDFFQAKAAEVGDSVAARDQAYRDTVKKKSEEKAKSKAAFKDKSTLFREADAAIMAEQEKEKKEKEKLKTT